MTKNRSSKRSTSILQKVWQYTVYNAKQFQERGSQKVSILFSSHVIITHQMSIDSAITKCQGCTLKQGS